MDIRQVQFDGRFGFDPGIDPCLPQRLQVGLRIAVGQITLERDGATIEQALDGGDIAFEQIGQVELGRGDIDAGLERAVENDLLTGFAHGRGILVAR